MNNRETLTKLDQLMREASAAEVIDFVEKMVKKRPALQAMLMDKLKEQRKSLPLKP